MHRSLRAVLRQLYSTGLNLNLFPHLPPSRHFSPPTFLSHRYNLYQIKQHSTSTRCLSTLLYSCKLQDSPRNLLSQKHFLVPPEVNFPSRRHLRFATSIPSANPNNQQFRYQSLSLPPTHPSRHNPPHDFGNPRLLVTQPLLRHQHVCPQYYHKQRLRQDLWQDTHQQWYN